MPESSPVLHPATVREVDPVPTMTVVDERLAPCGIEEWIRISWPVLKPSLGLLVEIDVREVLANKFWKEHGSSLAYFRKRKNSPCSESFFWGD